MTMPKGTGKYIKIENPKLSRSGVVGWATVPRGERTELWSVGKAEAVDSEADSTMRHLFQIAHLDGVSRLSRVTFMGQHFRVLRVSQASRLNGMELQCEAIRESAGV
jgi:hypothetical protein